MFLSYKTSSGHAASIPQRAWTRWLSPSVLERCVVLKLRIICCQISLLRLWNTVNYSYIRINRINFSKRCTLAQQFLAISGANLITAVFDRSSATSCPPQLDPSPSSSLCGYCCRLLPPCWQSRAVPLCTAAGSVGPEITWASGDWGSNAAQGCEQEWLATGHAEVANYSFL